ncbi:MAG TPA: MarR family transcriptional regulator [Marinagarivorans sp.]
MHTLHNPVAQQFIEQMGHITQADGLPRIAGQILGLLLLESEPLSFAQLAIRLKVSRGSVSTNTRLLESLGVVTRSTPPNQRGDFFRLSEAPYSKLLTGITERMETSKAVVEATRATLPQEMTAAHARLAELGHFYRCYLDSTRTLIQQLEHPRPEATDERSK